MDPIQEAIRYIESREPGDDFSYREVARKYGVDRTTLSRRHQGKRRSYKAQAEHQRLLNLQQELELVRYIEELTRRGLPPTREMVGNFASAVANWEVSESWITRFLQRHADKLTTKWATSIDRQRHEADSREKYEAYFNTLHTKMREYDLDERNTYNMDEEGFFVGIASRSKRVFSKAVYKEEKRTQAIKDGNREWVTLIACVCASGEALPPALIYQGSSGIQSTWVNDVEVGKHEVFFSNSPSGWSNDDLGLAWLEQVFNRYTTAKARQRWRLLILDGHGSHITKDFLNFCDANRILLAIFPPHSTHSLQPLDVVLFSPLAKHYTTALNRQLQQSQGHPISAKKAFFTNFWAAWSSTMKPATIRRSFEATGVWPIDAQRVLKRFNNSTPRRDYDSETSHSSGSDTRRKLHNLLDELVEDRAKAQARELLRRVEALQVNNKLLREENAGLRDALTTKKKHKKKRNTLDLQQREEYHSAGVFWSPRKLREAEAREATRQREAEAQQLQKLQDKELKAGARLYKKKQAEAAKAARQEAAEERRKAKKARASEVAAARALRKQQREAATSQKSHDTANKAKRKASHSAAKNPTKRRRVVGAASQAGVAPELPPPPPKTTRTRSVRPPSRYSK
ncbi:pogo transposable [Stemphylium lycopersici]|uniref:Pogo transposable n=1 Tax=Stemphylium lycopersici TaxID=183478 RepID=A0A364MRN9_STELY|nr:pogo transposable [Stemphylium lycopersici]RAR00070.1 pogo transposable [Stemphylium lycopersici]